MIDHYAKIIWNYHLMHHEMAKSDCIFVLGSNDTRVAERGAQLYLEGWAPVIAFSGGFGRLTDKLFDKPEAQIFAELAIKMGVPEDKIIIEDKSTNTGENVHFTREKLLNRGITPQSIIAVQKPYMERRTYATIKKVWPEIELLVTSPGLTFDEYCHQSPPAGMSFRELINVMVGDLDRIRVYPQMGFQIAQEIPHPVIEAFEKLVELGFTDQLVFGKSLS